VSLPALLNNVLFFVFSCPIKLADYVHPVFRSDRLHLPEVADTRAVQIIVPCKLYDDSPFLGLLSHAPSFTAK